MDNKQYWHCLRCVAPQAWAEDAAAYCFDLGSCGLQSEELDTHVRLSAYFVASFDGESIRRAMAAWLTAVGVPVELEIARVEEAGWEAGWRRFFQPIWVTPRLVVHPSWRPVSVGPEQLAIVIDPQMAFGTGGHESTRLCLQALEKYLATGDRCLDLGTGSGILAIAAARLGAAHVLAVDVDYRALENARENLVRNGLSPGLVEFCLGRVEQGRAAAFDLVLANIQRCVLVPLLEPLVECLANEGRALFAGLLAAEEQEFCAGLVAVGMRVERVLAENDWICVVARKGA